MVLDDGMDHIINGYLCEYWGYQSGAAIAVKFDVAFSHRFDAGR